MDRVLLVAVIVACCTHHSDANVFQSAIQLDDIDVAGCTVTNGSESWAIMKDDLYEVFGLRGVYERPQIDIPRDAMSSALTYKLTFKRRISFGTMMLTGNIESVSVDGQDISITRTGGVWNSPTFIATMPEGTSAKSVRIQTRDTSRPFISRCRLLKQRLRNITPDGYGYADEEYTRFSTGAPPVTFSAEGLVNGVRPWINVGKNQDGRVIRAPLSELDSARFLLVWPTPQTLEGLYLQSNLDLFDVETYVGPNTVNPRVGTRREWKKVQFTNVQREGESFISFAGLKTQGIRLVIRRTHDARIVEINSIQALTLTPESTNETPTPSNIAKRPPVTVNYALDFDGQVSVVINDANGRRVRNLVSRSDRTKGLQSEAWDLRDDNGKSVGAGSYKAKVIAHPPLDYRYEMTVYPNVSMNSPQNSPWLNGHHGTGGWLADHSPNTSICAANDTIYMGAYVAESGVPFIETDLTGAKLWGRHSFAAWTGPQFLATDNRSVFVASRVLNTENDMVWAVGIDNKETSEFLNLNPTTHRKRKFAGITAGPKHVYLSINADNQWLVNAASAADVDIENTVPRYRPERKPRYAFEIVPNPRGDMLRLFRLTGTPPGYNDIGLTWLETEGGKSARQHLLLPFNKPVAIGSAVFPKPEMDDVSVRLSILKPGAKYPPSVSREADWIPFKSHGGGSWDVATAPEGAVTRALRVTFVRGEDDIFAEGSGLDISDIGGLGLGGDGGSVLGNSNWQGKLEGMKLLRRRYENVATTAKVWVSSGKYNSEHGTWFARRNKPLSPGDPAIFGLQWTSKQSVRGMAFKEIDGKVTEIDVVTGTGPVNFKSSSGWKTVGSYQQERRDLHSGFNSYNGEARYLDGYVDFGESIDTKAVRLRVIEQWTDHGNRSDFGQRNDLGGKELDTTRCRVWGVAALKHVGGEKPIDPIVYQRVESYDSTSGKLVREVPLKDAGQITRASDGRLYAVSGSAVVRLNWDGQHEPIVTDVIQPTALTVDQSGRLYVFDADESRRNVRVIDQSGKLVRTIGTPGGFKAGTWDPTRMGDIGQLACDRLGQLWTVEKQYFPKRITKWTTDGEFQAEFLGNTSYGGGGVLDPWDKSRLFYGPLEFEIDWNTGTSKLKNLTWTGKTPAGEVPMRVNGRTYVVTRPPSARMEMPTGIVYLYENDQLRPVAAMGRADGFDPLKDPAIQGRLPLGGKGLPEFLFIWSDLNADGEVAAQEVSLSPAAHSRYGQLTMFNRDLSAQAGSDRYQVKSFLDSGVPIYERVSTALPSQISFRLGNGLHHHIGNQDLETGYNQQGEVVWSYPSERSGTHGYAEAGPYHMGQVVGQMSYSGIETAHAGDLGEFLVIHANSGVWNLWTSDGILAAEIFRDQRDPRSIPWRMEAHDRGMSLNNVTVGQEHFRGYVCRTVEDDKYYAVVGHNHISLVELVGLDKFKRFEEDLNITTHTLVDNEAWQRSQEKQHMFSRAPVVDCYQTNKPPVIDGEPKEWRSTPATIGDVQTPHHAKFNMSYDDRNLYLCYQVNGMGPMKNVGEQFDLYYKTGAAVDLQIGLNPDASASRAAPVEGDLRLLLTRVHGQGKAVLYRPVVPGTPASKVRRVVSPVAETRFDDIRVLTSVKIAVRHSGSGYVLEASIPLKELGLSIDRYMRLKMDWGVLSSGPDGHVVLRRTYWANRATQITADAPSEARLHPDLWGHVRFHGGLKKDAALPSVDSLTRTKDSLTDDLAKDLVDDLELDLE